MLHYIPRLYTLYTDRLHVSRLVLFWERIYMYEITNARAKVQQRESFLLITKHSWLSYCSHKRQKS